MRVEHGALTGLVLLSLVATCHADDCESGWNGDQIVPVDIADIRMARERVECHVEWPTERSGHCTVRVTAEFVLVNESERALATMVAFPSHAEDRDFGRWSRTRTG